MMNIKKVLFLITFLTVSGVCVFAQEQNPQQQYFTPKQTQIRITANDIKLIPENGNEYGGGGYHLYVRKLPGVGSILLTETTKDPAGKSDSYAYRAKEYNPVNGDEIRYLDGKPLVSEGAKYSLVDSTVENTSFFGPAFHIYVPSKLVYGYQWSRNGEVEIGKGTFINIRSFEKKYADYTGDYLDNPFMFDLVRQKKTVTKKRPAPKKKPDPIPEPIPEPEPVKEEVILTDDYNPVASEKFIEIAEDMIYSKGPETIVEDIMKVMNDIKNKDILDVVFAIDATGSMKNDIDKLKKDLMPQMAAILSGRSDARIGLLFYRDYGDTYKYMNLPVQCFAFSSNFNSVNKNLNSVKILGTEGGDIPEAVYEAIYASTEFYNWRPEATREIILIGDAEPHPTPRGSGKYSKDYVMGLAKAKGITVHSILLPKD